MDKQVLEAELEYTTAHPKDDLLKPPRSLFHLAFFTACLVAPIGIIPYLAARRKTGALNRRINESFTMVNKLQRDVNTLQLDQALRRDELIRFKGLINEMKQETHAASLELKRDLRRLRVATESLESTQTTVNDALRGDLFNALEDAR